MRLTADSSQCPKAQDVEHSILRLACDRARSGSLESRTNVKRTSKQPRYRATLGDLIVLYVFSRGEYIDGLWIGVDDHEREPVLERLRAALVLIKTHDPLRYHRLTRDLKLIWATPLHGPRACFYYRLDACSLNPRYVCAEWMTPELLAATIVHESTHARLWGIGFRYEEEARPRVEAVCVRRELAFAAKLPHGGQVRDRAEEALAHYCTPASLSNAVFAKSYDDYAVEELRRFGTPEWVIRGAFALRRILCPFVAVVRKLKRRRAVGRAH